MLEAAPGAYFDDFLEECIEGRLFKNRGRSTEFKKVLEISSRSHLGHSKSSAGGCFGIRVSVVVRRVERRRAARMSTESPGEP